MPIKVIATQVIHQEIRPKCELCNQERDRVVRLSSHSPTHPYNHQFDICQSCIEDINRGLIDSEGGS